MLLAQAIAIHEIPEWVLWAFIVALVATLYVVVSWVLSHPKPE